MSKYNNPSVGCYVDESHGSADDCNRRTIEFAEQYGFETGAGFKSLSEEDEDYSQFLSEEADEAVNYLNDNCESRIGLYWVFEDNSLFLMADVESAKESVDFVSSKEKEWPDDDFRGDFLHINERGNTSLYLRKDKGDSYEDVEIWSIV